MDLRNLCRGKRDDDKMTLFLYTSGWEKAVADGRTLRRWEDVGQVEVEQAVANLTLIAETDSCLFIANGILYTVRVCVQTGSQVCF
jgi:hypothetical protein